MSTPDLPNAWETAPALQDPPPDDLPEEEPFRTATASYWECGYSGWHLALAWLAGPATIVRYPDTREHYWDVTEYPDDGTRRHRRRLTEAESAEIDEDWNGYLRDVGIPDRRPGGYRWFQLLPEGRRPADVSAAAHQAINDSGLPAAHHPREAIPFVRRAIEQLYRS
ncbi:DUF5956 family protein [Actinoplanes sp. NPDC049118]|uniref:DUF5956 family protein n=1 Tax=Actinoplanes sp. NPDC049118 TaxID=3155769 RepID=UPI0033D74E84